jgi:hypothetical protein
MIATIFHRRAATVCFVLSAAAMLLATSAAHAQTSAALLIKPWEASGSFEDQTSGFLFSSTRTHGTDQGFHLETIESMGRMRLFPGMEASPRLGYDVTYLNPHTSQPGFPSELLDASFAAGAFVGKQNGWIFGFTAGLGYAGDRPFADGRGWYGKADFLIAKKFTEQDALGVGLDYDGHRSFLPDVPLPGFGYSHTFDPRLQMVLGAPLSSITWTPADRWRLYADYLALTDFDVDIGYRFIKHWTVFGAFDSRRDQFHISEIPGQKRLLYSQKRLEGGIRFVPYHDIRFIVAGGYAFSTDFREGYDYRSSFRFLYAKDAPYLRAGFDFKF